MGSQNASKRKILIRQISRQGNRCHICGGQMSSPNKMGDPNRATADHLVPKSLGGPIVGNIAAAHAACNEARGNKRLSEMDTAL